MTGLPGWVQTEFDEVGIRQDGPIADLVAEALAGQVPTDGRFGTRLTAAQASDQACFRTGWVLLQAAREAEDLEQLEPALALARHAVAAYTAASPWMTDWQAPSVAAARARVGRLLRALDRFEDSAFEFGTAHLLWDRVHDDEEAARTDYEEGHSLLLAEQRDRARTVLERASAYYEGTADVFSLACCDRDLGDLARQAGDHDEAVRRFTAAYEGFLAADAPEPARVALVLRGITRQQAGHIDEALADLTTARDQFDAADALEDRARADMVIAETHFGQGEYDAARDGFARALPVFELLGDEDSAGDCRARLDSLS